MTSTALGTLEPPSLHLVITNIQKHANVKKLLLSAAAFGCCNVFVVGQAKFDFSKESEDLPNQLRSCLMDSDDAVATTVLHNDSVNNNKARENCNDSTSKDNLQGKMSIQRVENWDQCVQRLQDQDIVLVGVEIHESAVTVNEFFENDNNRQWQQHKGVAFLMGNEGQGILPKHMASCQAFVRIPQYGVGTASLNVYVAASIVLQRFHQWQRSVRLETSAIASSQIDE